VYKSRATFRRAWAQNKQRERNSPRKAAYDDPHMSWVGHICAVVCVCLTEGDAVESGDASKKTQKGAGRVHHREHNADEVRREKGLGRWRGHRGGGRGKKQSKENHDARASFQRSRLQTAPSDATFPFRKVYSQLCRGRKVAQEANGPILAASHPWLSFLSSQQFSLLLVPMPPDN
jgi:hypothetical protein